MLVDTHCHLDFPQFEADLPAVLERARLQGVERFINVGADLKSSRASCELAKKHKDIYASVGVHPHDADSFTDEVGLEIRVLAKSPKVVSIGECGLDYYRNLSSVDNQISAFRKQIILAKDLGLPLVVHTRQAEEDTMAILKESSPLRAVIHCFSSHEDFLKQCLELGFYISLTCNITYRKAEDLRKIACLVPSDRLLLETDAPYLSPEGLRGKRNEPANVRILAQELSNIRGVDFSELCRITTENAFKFFRLS